MIRASRGGGTRGFSDRIGRRGGSFPIRIFRVAGVLLLLALALHPGRGVAGTDAAGDAGNEETLVGKEIPTETLADSTGRKYSLPSRRQGGVDVVNFWGIRCGSCLEEIPKLEDLYVRYREKGMTVYGINADGTTWEVLRPLLEKTGLKVSFPLFTDGEFRMMDAYRVMATPMTVILDGRGVVRYQHLGYQSGDEKKMESEIATLLDAARVK